MRTDVAPRVRCQRDAMTNKHVLHILSTFCERQPAESHSRYARYATSSRDNVHSLVRSAQRITHQEQRTEIRRFAYVVRISYKVQLQSRAKSKLAELKYLCIG
jgi:hypothetical protein